MAPKRKADLATAREGTRKSRRLRKESPGHTSGFDPIQKEAPVKKAVSGKTPPIDVLHFQKPTGVTQQEWKRMLGTLSKTRLIKLYRVLGISGQVGSARAGNRTTTSMTKSQLAAAIVEALPRRLAEEAASIQKDQNLQQAETAQPTEGGLTGVDWGSRPNGNDDELHGGNSDELFNRLLDYWRTKKAESGRTGHGFPKSVDVHNPTNHDLSLEQVATAIQCLTESMALQKYHSFVDELTWQGVQDGNRIHRPRRRLIMPWLVTSAAKAMEEAAARAEKQKLSSEQKNRLVEDAMREAQAQAHLFLISVEVPLEDGVAEDPEETYNPTGIPQMSWYDSGEQFVGDDGSEDRNRVLLDIRTLVNDLQWYTYPIARSTAELIQPAPWLPPRKVCVPAQSDGLRGCGIFAVLNGWAVALSLKINPSALTGRSERDMETMMNEALELMELSTSSNMDLYTIFVYFRRWNYITEYSRLPLEFQSQDVGLFRASDPSAYLQDALEQEEAVIISLDLIEQDLSE